MDRVIRIVQIVLLVPIAVASCVYLWGQAVDAADMKKMRELRERRIQVALSKESVSEIQRINDEMKAIAVKNPHCLSFYEYLTR